MPDSDRIGPILFHLWRIRSNLPDGYWLNDTMVRLHAFVYVWVKIQSHIYEWRKLFTNSAYLNDLKYLVGFKVNRWWYDWNRSVRHIDKISGSKLSFQNDSKWQKYLQKTIISFQLCNLV